MTDEKLRETVRLVLAEVVATDPTLGDAAVERLGFEIVGFMTAQAHDTRQLIANRLLDMSRELIAESTADYDEAMLKGHGVNEAFFAVDGIDEADLGIPLNVFKKV